MFIANDKLFMLINAHTI